MKEKFFQKDLKSVKKQQYCSTVVSNDSKMHGHWKLKTTFKAVVATTIHNNRLFSFQTKV